MDKSGKNISVGIKAALWVMLAIATCFGVIEAEIYVATHMEGALAVMLVIGAVGVLGTHLMISKAADVYMKTI